MGALYKNTNLNKVSRFTKTRNNILNNYIETLQCLSLGMAQVTFPHSPLAGICHMTTAGCKKLGNVVNKENMW